MYYCFFSVIKVNRHYIFKIFLYIQNKLHEYQKIKLLSHMIYCSYHISELTKGFHHEKKKKAYTYLSE